MVTSPCVVATLTVGRLAGLGAADGAGGKDAKLVAKRDAGLALSKDDFVIL
ncbi:hypothetical protein [Bauldia sp.]|uniref:hypothetical protein n=1 Tax=Bauldia sp. TaxID=2575872 RepID=UPI003BAB8A34